MMLCLCYMNTRRGHKQHARLGICLWNYICLLVDSETMEVMRATLTAKPVQLHQMLYRTLLEFSIFYGQSHIMTMSHS